MNCGFTNNCGNNAYYCGNDCGCDADYSSSCETVETSCSGCAGKKGNCTTLMFIIAIIMIFCR